jgi:pyridoxamine 5'-phosphate oxidase
MKEYNFSHMSIADIRTDYNLSELRRKDLDADPIKQFQKWFTDVLNLKLPDPNAMTLATADKKGRPSARTVLLKGIDERGFSFFTNYDSRKGRELSENPFASIAFYWQPLARQVCVTGKVSRLSRQESETYFHTRPVGSQLSAWASNQSQVIENREILEKTLQEINKKYGNKNIPTPPHWGGFLLEPDAIEFWQGRPNRLHDRFRYIREKAKWQIERLSP